MDETYLLQALELAKIQKGFCAPNPSVGALVVKQNRILATGYHLGPGHAHAEVDALKKLTPEQSQGATVYVTLEPCSHMGRTPPCTQALIQAGVHRVIFGFKDPNPIVNGKGKEQLLQAGIACEHLSLAEINRFYTSYQHWHRTHLPFVTAKLALSLNGKIAGNAGQPLQITGEELSVLTHLCRKKSDAILTTAKTIRNDNPKLNARLENGDIIAKPLYVLDTQLTVSPEARVFKTAKSVTLFCSNNLSLADKKEKLLSAGARCIEIETDENGLMLEKVFEFIGKEGVHDVWVEAGGKCFSTLAAKHLLNRALIYIAPHWILAGMEAFPNGCHFDQFAQIRWYQVGKDVVCEMQ